MWKFSLFSQHYHSVYESSTYDVFCLSVFIAFFLAIKPLWAVLYTSEQVCRPDGCSNKWGETSEALLHTWAVRRTTPAPHGQHWPCWGWACFAFSAGSQEAQGPPLQEHSLHWGEAALHCLTCLAVSLRPAPESQNLTRMFSVFPSWMTHMAFAINTTLNISKVALNGNLLADLQNHNLTILQLLLIISIMWSAY